MKRLFLLVLLISGVSVSAQDPVEAELAEKLQFTLDSAVTKMKLIGVSVNMIMPDGKVWNATSGYADPYAPGNFEPDQLFWSASMGKMFTGGIIFQLAEEGKLSLEDKIGMYFNDIPYIDTNITLRELIKHRSGIAEVLSPASTAQWYNNPDKVWTGREVLETYLKPKSFAHGTNFEYSNSNFILLAMVIEKITGNTMAHELNTRFFTPLGMQRSYYLPENQPTEPIVPCWADFNQDGVWDDQANFIHSTCFASMVSGAGAILSQPCEFSKYTRALYGGELVNDSTLDQIKQCTNVAMGPYCNGYGMATMRYSFSGKSYYGHGGDISGFTNLSIHQPETNLTLTLMINQDRQNRALLALVLLRKINQITTGIEDYQETNFQLVKNPVDQELELILDEEKPTPAEIRSVAGQLIKRIELQTGQNRIDVSYLNTGVYQLLLNTEMGLVSRRFVKQ